jgi:hypothetical protein
MAAVTIATIGCKKKEDLKPNYTVSYYAYSKNVPFAVQYHDDQMNWSTDSIYSNMFTKEMTSNVGGMMYVLTAKNGKKITNDSIYVRMTIGDQKSENSKRFSNTNASISTQLTSPQ